jgi:hypothetical protein
LPSFKGIINKSLWSVRKPTIKGNIRISASSNEQEVSDLRFDQRYKWDPKKKRRLNFGIKFDVVKGWSVLSQPFIFAL